MIKILVLSFYYEPDLSAGSFRTTSFINSLVKKVGSNTEISIFTTLPNRYHTYGKEAHKIEKKGNVTIRRFNIPTHKSGILDQSNAFLSFYRQCLKYSRKEDYSIVYATSSRLFTAYLGYRIAKMKNLPLYLDIRDIFVDTIHSIYENRLARFIIPMFLFRKLEKRIFQYASRINLVSAGFKEYFTQFIAEDRITTFSNGIDQDFLEIDFSKKSDTGKKKIVYAGNIGDGQGLHKIIPEMALELGDEYIIQVIGAGGMYKQLEDKIIELKVKNVSLIDPVPRAELRNFYREADFLLLHLNDYKAFEKVLPSKVFEYGATGKPVIAGVGGYAREFIIENLANWMIFQPTDINDFVTKFTVFKKEIVNPSVFINKYKRTVIMNNLVDSVLSIIDEN